MELPFALMLDIILAILLAVTIVYAFVLNKRLAKLRSDRGELQEMAASFNQATERAGDSIGKLKTASDALQEQLMRAESLRDDLVFLIDRGTGTADRLEENVRIARDDLGDQAVPPAGAPVNGGAHAAPRPAPKVVHEAVDENEKVGPKVRSDAEKALLKALRSAG